jgi:hypothetical protein
MKIKTVELFCGLKSFSNVATKKGYATFTIDIDPSFAPTKCADILSVTPDEIPHAPTLLWASPPCQGFSVAVIGRNWNHDGTPKTDSARLAMEIAQKTLFLIKKVRPKYWFIENPRGMLRKMPWMEKFLEDMGGVRHTISYCQYGDTRQKPTDIWTNALFWKPRAICKPGAPCHEPAPRGSRTGTQGIKGEANRSAIPAGVFEEIFKHYERGKK